MPLHSLVCPCFSAIGEKPVVPFQLSGSGDRPAELVLFCLNFRARWERAATRSQHASAYSQYHGADDCIFQVLLSYRRDKSEIHKASAARSAGAVRRYRASGAGVSVNHRTQCAIVRITHV